MIGREMVTMTRTGEQHAVEVSAREAITAAGAGSMAALDAERWLAKQSVAPASRAQAPRRVTRTLSTGLVGTG